MSFTNFTTGNAHSFGGKYLELVAERTHSLHRQIRRPEPAGRNDDDDHAEEVSVGTELNIVQEGIPDVIPPEACYLGWQESLTLLAKLVKYRFRISLVHRARRPEASQLEKVACTRHSVKELLLSVNATDCHPRLCLVHADDHQYVRLAQRR